MQVSRITVRAAVDELEQDGFCVVTVVVAPDQKNAGSRSWRCMSGSTKQILFIYFSSVRGHLVSRTGTSSRLYHGVERLPMT